MQLNITGRHLDVTESMHNYVTTKLERVERHFDHVTNVHVILSVEKLRQKAEATIHVAGGNLFADAENEDMSAINIENAANKISEHFLKNS